MATIEDSFRDIMYTGIVLNPIDRLSDNDKDIRDNPLYYIEIMKETTSPFAMCYLYTLNATELKQYHANGNKLEDLYKLKKKYKVIKPEQTYRVMETTILGKELAKRLKSKGTIHNIKTIEDKPLFVTPMFEAHDTFSHNLEEGFAEYAMSKPGLDKLGKPKAPHLEMTGVFIGKSNIVITSKTYPQKQFIESLKQDTESAIMIPISPDGSSM